jgi:hypothetical protein
VNPYQHCELGPFTVSFYDDFSRPLNAQMGFTMNVNLAQIPDEISTVGGDFDVAALSLLQARKG